MRQILKFNQALSFAATACAGTWIAGCLPPAGDQTDRRIPISSLLDAEEIVPNAASASAIAVSDDGLVFYAERKTGQIRVYGGGTLQNTAFATVPVNFAGERGLLDIALHPNFANNRRVYALYSRSDTGLATDEPSAIVDTRVVFFTANGSVASGGETFVASLPGDASTIRVGGRIAFNRASQLFVAIGDLENAAAAQSASPLLAKVLRYNDDGSVPTDNPDPASPAFALGLRDPRALSIDPVTGDPFAGDQNSAGFQEVNRIRADRNFGWPFVIGFAKAANELSFANATANYTDPLFETTTDVTSLDGGDFNPGSRYGPRGQNQLFLGDPAGRRVFLVELNAARTAATGSVFAGPFPSAVHDVAFSAAGTMFVACENGVYRVTEKQR